MNPSRLLNPYESMQGARVVAKTGRNTILVVLSLGLLHGCGRGPEVEVTTSRRGEIEESFSEPARTRLDTAWIVSMPVDGRIARIEFEPGDTVVAGQELVAFDRIDLEQSVAEARAVVKELKARLIVQDNNQLEETARLDAEASIQAAEESLKAAEAQVSAERARSERAGKELRRMDELIASASVARNLYDDAALVAETALIELRKQEFYRSAFNFVLAAIGLGPRFIDDWLVRKSLQREVYVEQLAQARARLIRAEHEYELAYIVSPITGVVLQRFERGRTTQRAGQKLLLIGNVEEIEAVADVLTDDALRLSPGSTVIMRAGSGAIEMRGAVKRVEPAGFVKVSSLGVEQQRVRVIVSLDHRPEGLGVGYRLHARFITARKSEALIVPRAAVLQDRSGEVYVYLVEGRKLKKNPVEIGLRSDLEFEIIRGLDEDSVFLSAPDATLESGESVRVIRP